VLRTPAGPALAAAALLALPATLAAQTPLELVIASPDVTAVLGGAVVADHQLVADDLQGGALALTFAPLPAEAAVGGIHLTAGGPVLFSPATVTELAGTSYRPGDVIAFDGATFSLAFDAMAAGLPPGVDVDAVTLGAAGELLLSFDVTVVLPGVPFADEDLVAWDGGGFDLVFDGSAAGVPEALDLDAAHRLPNGNLLLSFDGSGAIAGVAFADEDLLEYESPAHWTLAYDGSASLPGWEAADLDAVSVGLPPSVIEIPTLGGWSLALLAALLGAGALRLLGRAPAAADLGRGHRPQRL